MTKTDNDSLEAQKAKAEKEASMMPQSAGRLLDEARKADTRAEADAMSSQAPDPTRVNIVKQLADAQKEPEDKKESKPVTQVEYDRRSQLDVADPAYINPSLDHYTTGKK